MATVQQQKVLVEQLRREATVKRMKISQAVEELKKFILEREQEDCLLVGFHNHKANPFREKSSCSIL